MKVDFKPRLWQKQTLKDFSKSNYNALVEAPTAAGKTIFAIMVIDLLKFRKPGLKTVVVVPTINLLKQWKNELIKHLEVSENEIGEFYGAKKDSSSGKRFMLYVINSAAREKKLFYQQKKNQFDLVIHDEVHHIGAETYKKLLAIPFEFRLGISATPEREYDSEGTEDILKYFGTKICVPKEQVEIAPLVWNTIRIKLTNDEEENYNLLKQNLAIFLSKLKKLYCVKQNDFKRIEELSKLGVEEALAYVGTIRKMENIRFTAFNKLKAVCNLVKGLDSKTIIFCDRIAFVEKIKNDLMKNYPQREIFVIHSKLRKKEQSEQLIGFKSSNDGVLVAAKIVDEGFDVPDASIGVLVSFTKTKRQAIQRDGRILRFMNGKVSKKYILVIRDVDEEHYHMLLRKTEKIKQALNGSWIDFERNSFRESPDFRTRFNLLHLSSIMQTEKLEVLA